MLTRRRTDALACLLVFVLSAWVFHAAPNTQPGDSRYSLLLAENLLRHHDFALERYHLTEPDYRLEHAAGHTYYLFPPGTSVLSAPVVGLLELRYPAIVGPDGAYDVERERALDARLAALLMAAFVSLAFASARLLLSLGGSLVIAAVTAFGTQVFSTMSRAMWSDTWGVLLVGLAVFALLRARTRQTWPSMALLGTIEAWAYVVRPTSALVLVATALFLGYARARSLPKFVGVVLAWLALFGTFSWTHFGRVVPTYFAPARLRFDNVGAALFGNLISPSRGLLIYVPALVAVAVLMIGYWRHVRRRELAAVAAFVIVAHLVVLAGFPHWWGGHSYGARLTGSLVPWFVLLGVIAVDAASRAPRVPYAVIGVVGVLCAASIAINGVGAYSANAANWNAVPVDVDREPARLWSWRHAQLLAPFMAP